MTQDTHAYGQQRIGKQHAKVQHIQAESQKNGAKADTDRRSETSDPYGQSQLQCCNGNGSEPSAQAPGYCFHREWTRNGEQPASGPVHEHKEGLSGKDQHADSKQFGNKQVGDGHRGGKNHIPVTVCVFQSAYEGTADGNKNGQKKLSIKQTDLCPQAVPPVLQGRLVEIKVKASDQQAEYGQYRQYQADAGMSKFEPFGGNAPEHGVPP